MTLATINCPNCQSVIPLQTLLEIGMARLVTEDQHSKTERVYRYIPARALNNGWKPSSKPSPPTLRENRDKQHKALNQTSGLD